MPRHVVDRVGEALNAEKKPLNGSKVLIVGLAYKPNVDDDRESPSYLLMDLLRERNVEVAYHDPYVPVIKPTRKYSHWEGIKSVPWNSAAIGEYDAILIATAHDCIDYGKLGQWANCIVDTRNVMASVSGISATVWKA